MLQIMLHAIIATYWGFFKEKPALRNVLDIQEADTDCIKYRIAL